jgi:antitoxin component YwqK of YwqJK toxin-antitoxin module
MWLIAAALGALAARAHATTTRRSSIELLFPDCTEPAGVAWLRGVPPSFVFVTKRCSRAPGGPEHCSIVHRLSEAPPDFQRDEDVDGDDVALWPQGAEAPLIGTFEKSGVRCDGAPLYVFSSPLEPGDYQLRYAGGAWIHVAAADGDLVAASRTVPEDQTAPPATRPAVLRTTVCPRGAQLAIDDGTRTAACVRADGARDGLWMIWYASGAIMAAGAYADGAARGRFLMAWPGGGTFVAGAYDHGAPTGRWRVRNARGVEIGDGAYARGARDGRWRAWSADGDPAGDARYAAGALDGSMSRSDSDGRLRERGAFVNGALEGMWERWYANGQEARRETMRGGKGNGPAVWWDPDGTVAGEGDEQNGVRVGRWRVHQDLWLRLPDPAGDFYLHRAALTSVYRGDTPTGAWSATYPDGARAVEAGPVTGVRQSISIWFPDGTLRAVGTYAGSEPVGHWRVWRADGKLLLDGEYGGTGIRHVIRYGAKGNKEAEGDMWRIYPAGRWVMYYDDGAKQEEGDYVQPQPDVVPAKDGVWHGYHRNGRVYYDAEWKLGRQVGVSHVYWETGKLLATSTYVDGREVERVLYEQDGVTVKETRHY